MKMFFAPLAALGFALLCTPASAACFQQQVVPAQIDCGVNGSNSADFASPCTHMPARVVQVEVACPVLPPVVSPIVTPPARCVETHTRSCPPPPRPPGYKPDSGKPGVGD